MLLAAFFVGEKWVNGNKARSSVAPAPGRTPMKNPNKEPLSSFMPNKTGNSDKIQVHAE
ncbi:hypothetical protein HMPREF1210_01881 [Paenisporosarcina sp. HGH0030]|uniref:hypothetical protein n=1 Tax=Paenisporosarcina sp. HGH0030 TaxID=1078085 RepID=UPI00034E4377|nr:hypothetical protein [Paenisporosarcina sp. HGH0030]EPD51283.1 hypothetical protein HMPREF1210_01881 [Paenisporosarcina sp. HGH0030]